MQFRKHRLDNGLEIIAEVSSKAHSMAMAFFVNTGSRDESADVAGVSHFLEHMTFKGTPNRSAADVNRQLDEMGAQSNAYTSEEHTVYYVAVLPDYQSDALDLLADIMRPSLRQEDFDTEKKVIIEEIAKYDDQPPFGAHEKCMSLFFGDHPLGNSVLGTVESVTALTPESMHEYFRYRYSPGNMTLVASGNVDFDGLVESAKACCGDWIPHETSRSSPPWRPQSGTQWIHQPRAAQQYVIQIAPGAEASSPDRFARHILATIYGDESGSRLFWTLIDPGLADYAAAAAYEYEGAGATMTFISCDPADAQDNMRLVDDIQQDLAQKCVTSRELEIAKNKVCSIAVRRAERPSNRLFSVGTNWLQRGDYSTLKDTIECYQAVTVADIERSLKEAPLSTHATVWAGPLNSDGSVEATD